MALPLGDVLDVLRKSARVLLLTYRAPSNIWVLGDVNLDGKIDQGDIDDISDAFGSKPGDGHWNPLADLNLDSHVDLSDVSICVDNQGLSIVPTPETLLGLPDVVPGTPFKDIGGKIWLEAESTQSAYITAQAGVTIADMIGGDLALNMFAQPGWSARVRRAVEYMNAAHTFGVMPLVQAFWQFQYRPTLPGPQDLSLMLIRGTLTPDEYLYFSSLLGYTDEFSVDLYEAQLEIPGFSDLSALLWRGLIDDVEFRDLMLRASAHPDLVDRLLEIAWKIPGPGDLIIQVVREVISPADFATFMYKQGFKDPWPANYWEAHFRLPSPDFLVDAYHRGVISEAELHKYVFWHDYKPEPRPDISKSDLEIMAGIRKTLIPRVDLRRAWLQGEITDAEMETRYSWLGYEDDAALMARIQKAVALTPQRNTVRNMFLRGLRKGVYSEAVVRARLKELRYPGAAVDLLIEAENVRREIGAVEVGEEPRILSTSQITAAYKKRLLTREAAEAMLAAQGWDPGAADMLLMLSEPVPEKEPQLTAVKTAAATLYREGYMSVEEFEGHLRAANFSDEDIARIRLAEDLRYRWDFLKDLQAADVEAYRKDVLTLEELAARLLERDLQPERAAALLAKEAYKKLPKLKPAPA